MKKQLKQEDTLKHHTFLSSIRFYLKSGVREARRRKLYFCLALFSTLIAVAATAVSMTVISYTPLIFLKASESNTGAIDIQITPLRVSFTKNDLVKPDPSTQFLLLNTTAVDAQVNAVFPGISTSRYTADCTVRLTNREAVNCNGLTNPPYVNCPRYVTQLILQNSARGTDIGMAPGLDFPSEIPQGGIVITQRFANILRVKTGDTIIVSVDVSELFREVVIPYNFREPNVGGQRIDDRNLQNSIAYIPFKIYRVVSSMLGKLSNGQNDKIMTEFKHFFKVVAQYAPSNSISSSSNYTKFIDYLKDDDPLQYAKSMQFNLYNRMEAYTDSNFDRIQEKVLGFASGVSNAIGLFPYSMTLPVFKELTGLRYAGLFLGIVLNIIIVVLFILSTILIYNLLLVTVETKTFELGVIRMLGLTKLGVAQLILIQALLFALPGIFLGLVATLPLLYMLGGVLESNFDATIPIIPTGTALFWSLFIGFLIPLISSYYPMREALGKNLNLSLNLTRSKTSAVQISVEIDSKKIPWPQITFGILSVVFGFAIYIVLPLSLLSMNAGLLLALFFGILIGLLLGLALLALNFQHLMERFITMIFFFWTSFSFRSLILKNLVAHKLRNRQTAIMYSLSLGFVIFIIVALNQVLNNLSYATQARKGASLEITATSGYLSRYSILDDAIHANLTDYIESYTWITEDLREHLTDRGVNEVTVTHKGRLYSVTGIIRGISSTTFKTTINKYLVVDERDKSTGLDLAEQLYTPRGSQGVLLGTAYKDALGLSLGVDSSVLISMDDGVDSRKEELRPLAFIESSPGFTFSKLPSVTIQDMLISIPTWMRLAGNTVGTLDKIPMNRLLIKAKGDTNENLDAIVDELIRIKQEVYPQVDIWDYRDTEDTLQSNIDTLSFVFKAIEALVMILTLFSLITSMSTNIMEQTKEIAVLRAVGLTKSKINMLYVSEAFVLVISSAIFGILIGTVVGWTLSIQQVLFTQLPLIFHFPFSDLIIIFVAAVISAFVSAFFPARRVTKHPISKIIRLGA